MMTVWEATPQERTSPPAQALQQLRQLHLQGRLAAAQAPSPGWEVSICAFLVPPLR